MSRNACNGENGKNGEKSPASDNLSWMPKVAAWRLAILAKLALLGKNRQRAGDNGDNGEKRPGPLESGDFGEISDFGENCQRASDNGEKRPGPLETGDFGEVFVIFKHVNGWPHCFQS